MRILVNTFIFQLISSPVTIYIQVRLVPHVPRLFIHFPYITWAGVQSRGGGYLTNLSYILNFLPFSDLPKCCLPTKNHIYIWQVSLQLSCIDTYECDSNYAKDTFASCQTIPKTEINQSGAGNPHPGELSTRHATKANFFWIPVLVSIENHKSIFFNTLKISWKLPNHFLSWNEKQMKNIPVMSHEW